MEKFLFKKIEIWVVVALLLVGSLAGIGFGAAVLDAERETNRFGELAQVARNIAEIPDTTKKLISRDRLLLAYSNAAFEGKPTGWSIAGGPLKGLDGYILLSRYDGTSHQHKIELYSLPDLRVQHEWALDVDALFEGNVHRSAYFDSNNWNQSHFREVHPLLLPDGGMIVKDHYSPVFRVSSCGARKWINDSQAFHHSTEADADGNFWIPSLAERPSFKRAKLSFREDMITKIGPGGNILFDESVTQILLRNGYQNWLFSNGMYNDDPTHLNDIEPVMHDSPYWKKGDVFLSLRNISTILQYRPSTREIVWLKRGPWLSQHDVDILDDHRISIYDNNAQDRGTGVFHDGPSQIMVYDFETGDVTTPLSGVMKAKNIRTAAAGLYTALPSGFSLVEDVTDAHMIIIGPDDKTAAEFVNRADDGDVYHLGWSRYIDKQHGETALQAIRKAKCNG
ncbi:MAG: arylsulfotransferase family protein [Sphingobium sp.]